MDSDEHADSDPRTRRKKLKRREYINSARFLTFSCYTQYQLFNNDAIKDLFASHIALARERHRFRLIAWVIMPEHVHMLIIVRPVVGSIVGTVVIASESTVPSIFISMKRPFSEKVLKRWDELRAPILRKLTLKNGTRRFWQPGGGFDRNVGDEDIMWRKICYIHQNPVERGLVEKPENWMWSSARWYAGLREGQIPIDYEKGRREWNVPDALA